MDCLRVGRVCLLERYNVGRAEEGGESYRFQGVLLGGEKTPCVQRRDGDAIQGERGERLGTSM